MELKQTEHRKQLEDNRRGDDCCRAARRHGPDGKHNRLGHETHTPESRRFSDPPSLPNGTNYQISLIVYGAGANFN